MAKPVEDTVYFKFTVRSYDRGDYWIAKTRETGIYTYGETRECAEDLSGGANEYLVRRMKQEGIRALKRFLKGQGNRVPPGGRRSLDRRQASDGMRGRHRAERTGACSLTPSRQSPPPR